MDERDDLAERFEAHRARLRGVAYRMLGSLSDADDAVQEAWLRLSRSDASEIESLGGWLTTVVSRVSLDMLRSRGSRREDPLDERVPATPAAAGAGGGADPEQEALLADSVGLALLVVLETLPPAERLAFVLHDLFGVPFDEIAPIVERSPAAARQLASRARRRVQGAPATTEADMARRRAVVDAFLAASREGDFEGLLALLDPDVVLHADRAILPPGAPAETRGATAVARRQLAVSRGARFARTALVNGRPGVVVAPGGRLLLVLQLTIEAGRIAVIDALADPERLARLDLAVLDD